MGAATHGCHRGCAIRCSGIYVDKDGNFVTKQPEYETVWAHGGNCGIDDLDAIAALDRMDDDFGLDTIEMGATIGVAMEAGLAKFGDAQAAIKMVKEVGKGTPLGRILGNGAAFTGQGVRGRARTRGQGPGHAGLRSPRGPGASA
ncbi:MAG: aldehyde ferredoxin oxidoreductase C-terminal domain-containing protein [Desulfobacterales bacterium]|nr:aldehyde ferredoxin oxidoreductase C-terminal domain-containing protein [Desulfobacterales bacterium]